MSSARSGLQFGVQPLGDKDFEQRLVSHVALVRESLSLDGLRRTPG
jgi:hypothetical protein